MVPTVPSKIRLNIMKLVAYYPSGLCSELIPDLYKVCIYMYTYVCVCRPVYFIPNFLNTYQWLACWPLVPKIAGSIPAEAVGFFGRKNPQHAFLGGEVKLSPMSQICAACQRTLGLRGSRNHRQN